MAVEPVPLDELMSSTRSVRARAEGDDDDDDAMLDVVCLPMHHLRVNCLLYVFQVSPSLTAASAWTAVSYPVSNYSL